MKTLPFQTWGEGSETLYFAHANAYPPGSYLPIINALSQRHQVVSYLQRPLWPEPQPPAGLKNWGDLAEDVIRFFDQQGLKNQVAVGHSLGSVTAFMAAQKRPDLIKALVMIEPVTLSWWFCLMNKWLPERWKQRAAIINKTLNRPNLFGSKQAAFDFHRKARAFKRMDDAALWSYIEAGVSKDTDGFTLTYPREWEARIYATATYFRGALLKSRLPVLALRGEHSDTISQAFWAQWHDNPNHELIQVEGAGHLLPMEAPEKVIELIMPFVERHSQ